MAEEQKILIGGSADGNKVFLNARMANRHGVITGATGTGKTVTLQVLAESFSRIGVPVFMADVKGDLSGLCLPGKPHPKVTERIEKIGIEGYSPRGCPVIFWDLFGKKGHPVRTTITEMGPLLLGRLLNLNDTQEGLLHMAFKLMDDEGLMLLDLKDLRAMLNWMADNAKDLRDEYGNVAKRSVGAIQSRLLQLNEAGGEQFFGEPALDLKHIMQRDFSGNGVISLLDATALMSDTRLYTTFLLWLLSELFEQLDEVGDQEKPRLVFFFDEAHLLFKDAPKALVDKVEQVVRLIRSKGVGVYFVTQNPLDIPDAILGQMGNRIQHALRAFTVRDQKAVKAAAETFRPNPKIDTVETITQLGVGEALVSVLDLKGAPTVVEKTLICPPQSKFGPADESERQRILGASPLAGQYDKVVDRESAFELLKKRETEKIAAAAKTETAPPSAKSAPASPRKPRRSSRQSVGEAFVKSMVRTVGSQMGRTVIRGILGGIFGGR